MLIVYTIRYYTGVFASISIGLSPNSNRIIHNDSGFCDFLYLTGILTTERIIVLEGGVRYESKGDW